MGLLAGSLSVGKGITKTGAAPCGIVETIGPVLPNETVMTVLSPSASGGCMPTESLPLRSVCVTRLRSVT